MLHSGSTPLTGPDTAGSARRRFRALCVPLLIVVSAVSVVTVGAVPRHAAGADPVADLRSEATTVSHNLVLAGLEVDAAQQAASVASAKVVADQQAIGRLDQQLTTDHLTIARQLHVVQAEAIQNYMNSGAGSSSGDASLFEGGTAAAQAAGEYTDLAVGTITTELDELHTARRALQGRQAALQTRESQDRADQTSQEADLGQASTAATQLSSEQARVTGELAAAVAAQQAAEAAAASAAIAAARRSAPRTVSQTATVPVATVPSDQTTGTGTPTAVPPSGSPSPTSDPTGSGVSGDPYPSLPDPTLNPFLTCVVQAESGGNYGAVSPNGLYMGAFQFSQPTWNSAAAAAGLPLLVGVPPNEATKAEQDTVAVALYALDGNRPWLGDRCS